jgi:hypothetical protein
MDSNYRLKIKVGPHEFEGEGPAEFVREQFEAWKAMTTTAAAPIMTSPQIEAQPTEFQPSTAAPTQDLSLVDSSLGKIMKVENRVVSLTARPQTTPDAVLIILYGQKILRGNDSVTGGEVMDGLVTTGGYMLPRVDRLLESIASDGDVIVIGERRAKRYRLTNAGLIKARRIATDLLALVA